MTDLCDVLLEREKGEEGLRLKAYLCPERFWTIGYGRNLEADPPAPSVLFDLFRNGCTEEEAERWLRKDIDRAIDAARGHSFFDGLSLVRKSVVCDMIFNMGHSRFRKFRNTRAALGNRDYKRAAREILDSRYARQVPNRARRNALMMAEDTFEVDINKTGFSPW